MLTPLFLPYTGRSLLTVVLPFRLILVYSGIFTFLVDAYPLYAASALAANSFARSTFAAAFPLFGPASKYKYQSVHQPLFLG